jgi:hypothetical protein
MRSSELAHRTNTVQTEPPHDRPAADHRFKRIERVRAEDEKKEEVQADTDASYEKGEGGICHQRFTWKHNEISVISE